MKDQIVERLLTEGHITIQMAHSILNNAIAKKSIIESLSNDGNITKTETVILLKDIETPYFPFGVPNQTFPTMPLTYPPNNPGWTITCTNDLDLKL